MNLSNPNTKIVNTKLDDLYARFAAGKLSQPMHVLVAAHLAMRGEGRGYVSALEGLAGGMFERTPPLALPDRDACLKGIFAATNTAASQAAAQSLMPAPLHDFLGKDLADIKWRRRMPGLREYTVSKQNGVEANLYLIKAGHGIPSHTHEGSEFTLVLKGSFFDKVGRYTAGDIAIADSELDHHPIVDKDEDCLCYAVIDAPLHLTGPIGRIFDRFL